MLRSLGFNSTCCKEDEGHEIGCGAAKVQVPEGDGKTVPTLFDAVIVWAV